jgi:hypothetical protein
VCPAAPSWACRDTHDDDELGRIIPTESVAVILIERVAQHLYDDVDRRMIMEGIARLIIYLNKGVSEYVEWCKTVEPPKTPETRPNRKESWVVVLVADHDGGRTLEPGDKDWESPGGMPSEYEDGLVQSKGMMRHYVYGASRKERALFRQEVLKKIAKPEAAEETGVSPSA